MQRSTLDLVVDTIRRSEKSLSQLSTESGVSRSAISDWFRGTTSPTIQNAEAVLNTIGYTLTLKEMRNEDG